MNELLRIDCYVVMANTTDFTGLIPKKKLLSLKGDLSLYQLGEQLCPILSLEQLHRLRTEWQTHYHLEPGTWGLFPPHISGMEKEGCTSAMKSFDLEVIHVTSTHCTVARNCLMNFLLPFKEMGQFYPSFCPERE